MPTTDRGLLVVPPSYVTVAAVTAPPDIRMALITNLTAGSCGHSQGNTFHALTGCDAFYQVRPHTFSGLTGEPAYRQCFQLRQVVSLSLTSLEDVMRPRKKPHTLTHVHANVRLRLRLLLVASGVSARSYLKFIKSLVE